MLTLCHFERFSDILWKTFFGPYYLQALKSHFGHKFSQLYFFMCLFSATYIGVQ